MDNKETEIKLALIEFYLSLKLKIIKVRINIKI
jgi:hypothetical protein